MMPHSKEYMQVKGGEYGQSGRANRAKALIDETSKVLIRKDRARQVIGYRW